MSQPPNPEEEYYDAEYYDLNQEDSKPSTNIRNLIIPFFAGGCFSGILSSCFLITLLFILVTTTLSTGPPSNRPPRITRLPTFVPSSNEGPLAPSPSPSTIASTPIPPPSSDLSTPIPPPPTPIPPPTQASPPSAETSVPEPTFTPVPQPESQQPPCECTSDLYNCPNFSTHQQAQTCYDYCIAQGRGDIHGLDGNDNDGLACESLP